MPTHLFCGIVVRNHNLYAALIDQQGRALLCCQYHFGFLEDELPDIFDHLAQFAQLHSATLHIGLCDMSDLENPLDPSDPHCKHIICFPRHILYSTDLPRESLFDKDIYADAKVLAVLCCLKRAQSSSDHSRSSTTGNDQIPF